MQGRFRKERFDDNTSIAAFREQCERGAARLAKLPPGIQVRPDTIEGIYAEWLIPEGSHPSKVVLYVHGGGYVSGSCNDHRAIVSKFAATIGVACLLFEYRLAPEHPFPAALEDSVHVYNHLLATGFDPGNILIAGESAGGGLALAILLVLREQKIPMPAAVVSISPWTDLSCSGESYKTKNRYSLAPLDSWTVFSKHYVGNGNPENPLISPLFGNLAGLPPILVNAGADDELYDDGEQFALKASSSGVDVTFKKGERQVHCYPLLAPMFPEATKAMQEITGFIRKNLSIT